MDRGERATFSTGKWSVTLGEIALTRRGSAAPRSEATAGEVLPAAREGRYRPLRGADLQERGGARRG